MVWQSPKSRIGFPLGGTWIVPGATASETRSTLLFRFSSGPSKRAPIRSESGETANGSLVKRSIVRSSNWLQSTPRTKRNVGPRFAGLTQSYGAVHEEIPSIAAVCDRRNSPEGPWNGSPEQLAHRLRWKSPASIGNRFEVGRISILHRLADALRARLAMAWIRSEHQIRRRTTRQRVRRRNATAARQR